MKPESLFQKNHLLALLSLFGLYLMLRFQTINNHDPNLYISPLIWVAAAVLCLLPMFVKISLPTPAKTANISIIIAAVLLVMGFCWTSYLLHHIIVENPILASQSDVIPSLEVYVQRLLAGEKVYVAIPFEGYEVWPTYFPGMWLPYVIPEVIGFDYRWMAFISFYASISFMILSVVRTEKIMWKAIVSGILPGFMLWQLMKYDVSIFAFSTELMPITFYLWLIWGLFKKNPWIIGVFLSLCTLSRYAYTLWMIPFIVVIWSTQGFKKLLKIGIIGTGVILILYIIPFLMMDPAILTDGLAYYGKTAEDQWRIQSWQSDGEIPFHLANGRSISYWFYEFVEGNHIEKLEASKSFLKYLSLGFAILLSIVFIMRKEKAIWNKYLILSLFAYLVLFYAFLYVPFSYLYMLPLFVGLLCWIIYAGRTHSEI